jgi:Mn-containing catalase
MYSTDKKLQFPVRVEKPNPVFARALQQAIGGVEGEIRVALRSRRSCPALCPGVAA